MTKEEFVKKWNVGYESKEQQNEFSLDMKADLESLITTENERLRKGISLCLAAINGGLDGLELDNTCDVTENSFIIQQLEVQAEILNEALTPSPTQTDGVED